jgi:hypothetical protein
MLLSALESLRLPGVVRVGSLKVEITFDDILLRFDHLEVS